MPLHPILSPDRAQPLSDGAGGTCPELVHLAEVIDHPRMEIGAHSYAFCRPPPEDWAAKLAPYMFDDAPDRLIIGRFAHIAQDVSFLTATASVVHPMQAYSTYPFRLFDPVTVGDYEVGAEIRDIELGHDVWIGFRATIMPGVRLGHGAIVAAGAVVTRDVPPYTVVAGTPARPIRQRFDDQTIAALLEIGWWDWPSEQITRAVPLIEAADLDGLRQLAEQSTP